MLNCPLHLKHEVNEGKEELGVDDVEGDILGSGLTINIRWNIVLKHMVISYVS
jgi:hypothetical protein